MMLGVLLNHRTLKKMEQGKEKHENIQFYKKLAQEKGVDVCFYSVQRMKKRGKVQGFIYSIQDDLLKTMNVTLPVINMNRAILHKKKSWRKIKKAEKKHRLVFLNLLKNTARDKYHIFHLLKKEKRIKKYLPHTAPLTYEHLLDFLHKYERVMIKSNISSLGKKVYKMEKKDDHYVLDYIQNRTQQMKTISNDALRTFYHDMFQPPSSFHIQRYIPSLKYRGKKFDIRYSVQKNAQGEWGISGQAVRVAQPFKMVTNIYQGGSPLKFKKVEPLFDHRTKERMEQLCGNVATALEHHYPSLCDVGIDIVIDSDWHIWLLEINYRDQRYLFRESEDWDMWESSYRHPFEYAYAQLMARKGEAR